MLRLFEHKAFDRQTVMGFGILNGVSIGLLNLCLGFNSVGFYQVNFAGFAFKKCHRFVPEILIHYYFP